MMDDAQPGQRLLLGVAVLAVAVRLEQDARTGRG